MPLPAPAPLILAGALPDSNWLPLVLRQQAAAHPAWRGFVSRARLTQARIDPAGTVPEPGHLRYLAQQLALERPSMWPALQLLNLLVKHASASQTPEGEALSPPPGIENSGARVMTPSGAAGFWRLQPVHFLLGRDHIRLMDPGDLNLEAADARALWQAVQPVFAAEGFITGMYAPDIWWLSTPPGSADLALDTFSLAGAIGRSIEARLPQGAHRRRWQRLLNECQMIWHTHPVNAQRESCGLLPVNGLWLEGPARKIEAAVQDAVDSSPRRPAASAATRWLEGRIDDRLLEAQNTGNPSAWLDAWQRVCQDHFEDDSAPEVTILTGDGGWRVLGLSAKQIPWTQGLKRLLGRGSHNALDWLMP